MFDPKLKLEAYVQKLNLRSKELRSEEVEVKQLNPGQGTAILFNDQSGRIPSRIRRSGVKNSQNLSCRARTIKEC